MSRLGVALVVALALVVTAVPGSAVASPRSTGTEFWLAFPTNFVQRPSLDLFLTSETPASGTVSVPGVGVEQQFSTTPGEVTTVSLPPSVQMTVQDGVQPLGVLVEASADVSVYGLNRIRFTTDAYLGLPTDILGSEYVVMAYPGLSAYGSQFAVVAPQDGTEVTVLPSVSTGAHAAGVPFTVTLDRGQVYQLRASGTQDLTGTIITASKPVAAFSGASCANVPAHEFFCDHLVEQLTPPNTWGSNFATMPLATRSGGDTFRFLAAQDDTAVLVDGVKVAELDKGQVHEQLLDGPKFVASSKPILVAQFSNGQTFDGVVSDPFMMLIPPYEQFLDSYTVTTPATGFARNYINVVAPAGADVRVDGESVDAAQLRQIGDSGFVGAQVAVAPGAHRLEGSAAFGAFVYGFDSFDSYGYPAGLALRRFDPRASLFGFRRAAGWVGDPVNTGTGNLVDAVEDLTFPALWGMDVVRTYNGLDDTPGVLGRGWSLSSQSWVTQDVDGTVNLQQGDGRIAVFRPSEDGFVRPAEVFGDLQVDSDDTYSLHHDDGTVDDFDADGLLVRSTAWDGQEVTYARDAEGRVLSSTHSTGAAVTYDYDDRGRLVGLSASDGRTVAFGYSDAGDLTEVTDPSGGTTSYTTDDAGRMASEVDPAGRLVMATEFDALGRVVSQEQRSGETTTFDYDIAARTTTVTDHASGDVNRYHHDAQSRLTAVTDAAGAVLVKEYDGSGNLTRAVDRTGATTVAEYDDHGNITATTNPAGNTRRTVYDDLNRVVTIVDPAGGRTEVGYESEERIPSRIVDAEGGVTLVEVVDGLVRSVTDADGVVTRYDYDAARNLVAATDGLGNVVSFDHDAVGRRTSTTLPSGATDTVTYDPLDRVLSVTDAAGATTTLGYDASGLLLSQTDPTGATTSYGYDQRGNFVETVDALGRVTITDYDDNGQVTAVTRPGGAITTYEYGPLGRLETVTDPTGATTRFTTDAEGRLVETVDAEGNTRSATYDGRGLPVTRTDADGATTTFTYDERGLLVSSTDAEGATTSLRYDAVGRLLATTDPRDGTTSHTWTPAGRLASVVDPTGVTTEFGYDDAGRQVSMIGPDGGVWIDELDGDGRIVKSTTPEGVVANYQYDPVGRVTAMVAGDGGAWTREYTARGELARHTDPLGATVDYSYDAVGALVEVTDANGATTRFGYDVRSNRTSRTDASGAVQSWEYDLADRVVASTDPLGRTTTYTRDGLGRIVGVHDPSGRTQALTLDPVGRVVAREWGDGSLDTYDYDAVGRLVAATGPAGTATYAYDPTGNLVEATDPNGRTVRHGYDLAGRPTSTTYPGGDVAEHSYDSAGRLDTVTHPGMGQASHTWDRDGRLVTEALPDGQGRTFTYDQAGRLAGYDQDITDATRRTDLTRDLAGRITGETTAGRTTSYTYDPAGQLLSSQGPDLTATYGYDQLGRRTAATINGTEVAYTHDAAGQLTTETIGGTVREYAHDAAGRRTEVTGTNGTTTHAYDERGQLTETSRTAADGTTSNEQRAYDPLGQLLEIATTTGRNATTSMQLTWDQTRAVPQILTLDTGGDASQQVYGTRRLATVGAAPDAHGLFATDVHGSTIATPATAALAAGDSYDAWGNPISTAAVDCKGRPVHPLVPGHCAGDAAGGNPPEPGRGKKDDRGHPRNREESGTATTAQVGVEFGYRGELHIDALVHLRARDYDPAAGGFTTVDPLDGVAGTPTLANPYHYADNDPLNKIDPTGLRPNDHQFGAAGTIWGTAGTGWGTTAWGMTSMSGPAVGGSMVAPWTPQRCGFLYGSCGGFLTDMGRGFSNFSAGFVDHVVLSTIDFLVPDRWATTGRIGPFYTDPTYLHSYNIGTWTGVATDIAAGGRAVLGAWRGVTGAVRNAGSITAAASNAASRVANTARSWADRATSGLRSFFGRSAPEATRTVTIGRNMGERVIPYAERHGHDWYRGTPRWVPRNLIERVSPRTLERMDLWFNRRWIRGEMGQGSRIVDIGEPPGYPPSRFYDMELDEVSDYCSYCRDPQP